MSARDYANRDLLDEFSSYFYKSEGHQSAFGVTIEKDKLKLLPVILKKANLESHKVENIVIPYDKLISDQEVVEMAMYNEMAVKDEPQLLMNITIKIEDKYQKAYNNTIEVLGFNREVGRGSTLVVKPTLNKNIITCIVQKEKGGNK